MKKILKNCKDCKVVDLELGLNEQIDYEPKKTLYVIMPARNEAHEHLSEVIGELNRIKNLKKLIVIDDGSTDNTAEIVDYYSFFYDTIEMVRNEKNIGKEGSIKRGLIHLINSKDFEQDSWIALIDADGQHKVKDLRRFLYSAENKNRKRNESNKSDENDANSIAVFGFRNQREMPLDRKFANKLTSFLYSSLGNFPIKDPLFGQKVFHSKYAKRLAKDLNYKGGYRVEISLNYLLEKYGACIFEVPVEAIYNKEECSGKSGMGLKNLNKSLANLSYTIELCKKTRSKNNK